MPMLIACVMSLSALEERVSFKPGIITCTAVVAAMMIYQAVVDTDGLIVRASHRTNFSVYQTMLHFAVTVLSLVLLIVIVKSKRDKDFIPKLYIFSLICAYMCYGVMVQYLYSSIPSVEATTAAFAFGEKLPEECREGSPRIALSATNANLIWGADSPSHLNSLHDEGFTQFLDDSSLGFESGVYERITFDYKEICDLISVKYFAGLGETGDKYDGCRKVGTMGEYAIYENPDYIPMGFVYDSMISRDAFLSIEDKKLKHLTYLKALIVSDTTVFSDILTDISNTAGEEITDDEYKRLIEDRRRSAASSCEKTSNGLTAQIELEKAQSIVKTPFGFELTTDYNTYECKSVILATGVKPRKIGVEREDELVGNGVSYCALCDGAFYSGEDVCVIGDANTALQYALVLSGYCKSVHICTLFDKFFGDKALLDLVLARPNVRYTHNLALKEFIGEDELSALRFENTQTHENVIVDAKCAFICIGQVPNNTAFANLVELNKAGYIVADENCTTSCEGIFVAGDCRTKKIRQLVTAASDGSIAAFNACAYADKVSNR